MNDDKNAGSNVTAQGPPGLGQSKRNSTSIRIITNFPQQLPVLPAEIALIETYWAAFSQLNAGNDNQDLV